MASVPNTGDKLLAKVDLTVYLDASCTKIYPPVPPGYGYKKTWQYPGRKASGQEVGNFTGEMTPVSYGINFLLDYRVTVRKPPSSYYKFVKAYVKRDQVTGFWDKGVDAPKEDPPPTDDKKDNTDLYLMLAIGAAAIWKFSGKKDKK